MALRRLAASPVSVLFFFFLLTGSLAPAFGEGVRSLFCVALLFSPRDSHSLPLRGCRRALTPRPDRLAAVAHARFRRRLLAALSSAGAAAASA